jgi:hypothetical protein
MRRKRTQETEEGNVAAATADTTVIASTNCLLSLEMESPADLCLGIVSVLL